MIPTSTSSHSNMAKKTTSLNNKSFFPSDPDKGLLGSIKFNLFIGQVLGLPFMYDKNLPKIWKFCIIVYAILMLTIFYVLYTACEVFDLILCKHDINSLTQNAALTFSHISGLIKGFNLLMNMGEVFDIIERLKVMTKKYVISGEQRKSFYAGESENIVPVCIYMCVVFMTGLVAIIRMNLDPAHTVGILFPYRAVFPSFMSHDLKVAYISIGLIISPQQIIFVDYLNITLINQIRHQLKFLKIAFTELGPENFVEGSGQDVMVNWNVCHHIEILRLRNRVEQIFKYSILAQFLISLLTFALTGFQATVQLNGATSDRAYLIYFYCCCIFCQLFIYCWFGNEIIEQSKTLALTGYSTAWYKFQQKHKITLVIFLLNAQRPIHFTAGGFLNLSLATFSGILSKSYSYIAVLTQAYKRA